MLTISSLMSLAQENFVHMNLVRIFNEAKYFVEVSPRGQLDPEQTHKTRLQPS